MVLYPLGLSVYLMINGRFFYMDAQEILNRSYTVFKNYHIFMNLYAYLCDDKGYMQKNRLYPLLEKHLFSILIADPLYRDLKCLSFFINLYRFQTQELEIVQAKPFAPRSRLLRDQLINALEQELFLEIEDFDKHYQFRANRLALELTLLKDYYPDIKAEELEWIKLYRAAQYESHAYISVHAMALLEQAYVSFKAYNYQARKKALKQNVRVKANDEKEQCILST